MPIFVCSRQLRARLMVGAEPQQGAAHGVGGGLAPTWGFLCLSLTYGDQGEFSFPF